jgi:hypothetical protein
LVYCLFRVLKLIYIKALGRKEGILIIGYSLGAGLGSTLGVPSRMPSLGLLLRLLFWLTLWLLFWYSFTTVVWNGVGSFSNLIVHVSPLMLRSLYGFIYLSAYLVFSLCYIRTSELSGRLWIGVDEGLL